MSKSNFSKKVFIKLLGYPNGTQVRLRNNWWMAYPKMYIRTSWDSELGIPIQKFVGVIAGKNPEGLYYIRWIADNRKSNFIYFVWKEEMIEE